VALEILALLLGQRIARRALPVGIHDVDQKR